jgi:hypothetical protein
VLRRGFRRRLPPARSSREVGAGSASNDDDDPERFGVTIVLDEQANGKMAMMLQQLHPTVEQRDATIGFDIVGSICRRYRIWLSISGSPESHRR